MSVSFFSVKFIRPNVSVRAFLANSDKCEEYMNYVKNYRIVFKNIVFLCLRNVSSYYIIFRPDEN